MSTSSEEPQQQQQHHHHRPRHPALDAFRRHSSIHYQAFPSLRPPKSRGKPLDKQTNTSNPQSQNNGGGSSGSSAGGGGRPRYTNGGRRRKSSLKKPKMEPTPIPTRQLLILAVIALAEQTAFNSISPYLPEMVGQFPDVGRDDVGVSVGLIASAFAVAQFVTNFFWGHLSDRIGRKPVILCGTILTACAFVLFGFTSNLTQAILVQALMGMVNGNQGVVSTVLGEITDRSNQSEAFAYLPVVYGIGAILGPMLGGLLSSTSKSKYEIVSRFPYCLPNLASAALLVADFVLCLFLLDESLAEAKELPPIGKRIKNVFSWLWQFTSSTRPSYLRRRKKHGIHSDGTTANSQTPLLTEVLESEDEYDEEEEDDDSESDFPGLFSSSKPIPWHEILKPSTIILLITYFIFSLSMIGYNALYPIFVSSPPPSGREIPVREIGFSLAFAGFITILFQVGAFARIQDRLGNRRSFRASLGLFAVTFFAMPFVGYAEDIGKAWLWTELAVVLAIKVVASITALTCAMILITNCAPTPSSLGSLNGLAQTLSAAARSFGPFAAGGLFTLGTRVNHGEWLPWGTFGGVAIIGFIVSFGIVRSTEEGDVGRVTSTGQPIVDPEAESSP